MAVDHNSKRDWVFTESSMFDRVDDYATESLATFSGGRIEVRHFSWSRPLVSVWETARRCYLFNMSLSSQEPPSIWTHRDTGLQKQMGPGRLAFVPPGQRMSSSFAAGSSRSVCCLLDAEVVESFLSEAPEWNWGKALREDRAHVGGTEIEWLLRRMYREVQDPDFATGDVLDALAKQVAIEVVRKFRLRSGENNSATGGLAAWRMRLIRKRLLSDAPLPHLEELAALCDLTVRHLSRTFRNETGRSLGRYIESVMVERATALLRAGAPVGQVAKALGYAHSGAFASAFHRATGVRPNEVKTGSRRQQRVPRGHAGTTAEIIELGQTCGHMIGSHRFIHTLDPYGHSEPVIRYDPAQVGVTWAELHGADPDK